MPEGYLNSSTPLGGPMNNSNIQEMLEESGSKMYRIGGNGYDESGTAIGTDSSTNDYIRAMQIIQSVLSHQQC
jgi:hypothetical protein